jgi:glycosyltransferase involved in cell wall biosynthesis
MHHYADWLGLLLRRLTRRAVPVVSTLEGLLSPAGSDIRERHLSEIAGHPVFCQQVAPGVFRRMQEIYQRSDHIIAISPFLGRMAQALYGPKVSVLPLGLETLWLEGVRPPTGGLRVVGAGGVYPHKRPELFLEMAARFPEIDFAWFGEGSLRQSLVVRAAHRGLTNLSFPGSRSPRQLADAFRAADVFVLPSLSEGVPKVTQEAAAAGLAQLVFGFYEAPTVVDGRNGFVVWNDEELFSKLQQMLRARTMVAEMGRTGEAMAQKWAWELVAPQWEQRIVEVIERAHS